METAKTYSVKATPKDGSETYFIYNGKQFTDKEIAEVECKGCNKYWGERIVFTVIEDLK